MTTLTTAAERLTQALVRMAEAGDRPRCGEPDAHLMWLSEDAEDRAQAARWCRGCPVLAECAAAATELKATWGVWAGRDCGERPQRQAQGGTGAAPDSTRTPRVGNQRSNY